MMPIFCSLGARSLELCPNSMAPQGPSQGCPSPQSQKKLTPMGHLTPTIGSEECGEPPSGNSALSTLATAIRPGVLCLRPQLCTYCEGSVGGSQVWGLVCLTIGVSRAILGVQLLQLFHEPPALHSPVTGHLRAEQAGAGTSHPPSARHLAPWGNGELARAGRPGLPWHRCWRR